MSTKKTFTILCAYDVPCYATIEVEAESREEAARMIEEDFWGMVHAEQFEPEWSSADNPRAYVENSQGDFVPASKLIASTTP